MQPKVSICMVTYNHEKYIAQAIESVLMQQTDFQYELVIGEDCSTDGTREIVRRYAEQNPDRIRAFLRPHNLGALGRGNNGVTTLKECKGQYVALLEGDDYWTDPLKLQKQVGFLDGYDDHVLCFHNANVIYDSSKKESHPALTFKKSSRYTLRDVISGNFIPTCSVMYRNGLFLNFPDWYYTMPMGDWPLYIMLLQRGDACFMNEVMASYRVHEGGVWSKQNRVDIIKKSIEAAKILDWYTGFKFKRIIKRTISGWQLEIAELLAKVDTTEAWRNAMKSFINSPCINRRRRLRLLAKFMKRAFKKSGYDNT